jgi:hypothetical protein
MRTGIGRDNLRVMKNDWMVDRMALIAVLAGASQADPDTARCCRRRHRGPGARPVRTPLNTHERTRT